MNSIIKNTLLFDFYGDLLTDKQNKIYQLYYLEDLSLGEISEQMAISRQGVHDTIRRCHKQLDHYEQKLKLVKKFVNNKDKMIHIQQLTQELIEELTREEDKKQLLQIQGIVNQILDDL